MKQPSGKFPPGQGAKGARLSSDQAVSSGKMDWLFEQAKLTPVA